MYNWISTEGQVVIFSRDLSWVTDKIKGMMFTQGENLTICAEKQTELTKELSNHKVIMLYYEKSGYSPKSRFTIIHANKSGRQIAIANPSKKNKKMRHVIYESSNSEMDKHLLDVSLDLIEFTKYIAGRNTQGVDTTNSI